MLERVDARVLDRDVVGEGIDLALLVILGMVRDNESRPPVRREERDALIDHLTIRQSGDSSRRH